METVQRMSGILALRRIDSRPTTLLLERTAQPQSTSEEHWRAMFINYSIIKIDRRWAGR